MTGRTPPPWIAMYHSVDDDRDDPYEVTVTPGRLDAQLSWVRARGLRGVSVRELLDATARGAAHDLVGLTFDDGYADFLHQAVPLLHRHGCTATVFVLPGRLAEDNAWDELGPRKPLLTAPDLRRCVDAGMEVASHGSRHAPDPRRRHHPARRGPRQPGAAARPHRPGTGRLLLPVREVDARVLAAVRDAGYAYGCAIDPGAELAGVLAPAPRPRRAARHRLAARREAPPAPAAPPRPPRTSRRPRRPCREGPAHHHRPRHRRRRAAAAAARRPPAGAQQRRHADQPGRRRRRPARRRRPCRPPRHARQPRPVRAAPAHRPHPPRPVRRGAHPPLPGLRVRAPRGPARRGCGASSPPSTRWALRRSRAGPSAPGPALCTSRPSGSATPRSPCPTRWPAGSRAGGAPLRVRVVPNGIDAARFAHDEAARHATRRRLGLAPDAYVVGGRRPSRSRQTLRHPHPRAARTAPGRPAAPGGEGAERARLERLAQSRGVTGRVVWAGAVGAGELPGLLSAMDVFVSPSADEAFGLAVVEGAGRGAARAVRGLPGPRRPAARGGPPARGGSAAPPPTWRPRCARPARRAPAASRCRRPPAGTTSRAAPAS